MTRLFRWSGSLCIALGAALLLSGSSIAQGPPAGGPPGAPTGAPRGPRPAPTNIKALPKNISGDDLIKKMHEYEGALGVECAYCHAQNPTTKRNDFASDANPMKDKARVMITMTEAINAKYLTELATHTSTEPVSCGTCHRGAAVPPKFVPKPEAPRAPGAGMPGAMPPPAAH